jgi:hypothetical protein
MEMIVEAEEAILKPIIKSIYQETSTAVFISLGQNEMFSHFETKWMQDNELVYLLNYRLLLTRSESPLKLDSGSFSVELSATLRSSSDESHLRTSTSMDTF